MSSKPSLARTRREIERLSPGAHLDDDGNDVDLIAEEVEGEVVGRHRHAAAVEGTRLLPRRSVGDGTSTHVESVPSGAEPQDEERVRSEEEALIARRIAEAMGRLDARERHIVETRIMGEGKPTLRDLGSHFGFSRECARQLGSRGVAKLRRELSPLAGEFGWAA